MFERGTKTKPQVAGATLPEGLEVRVMPKEFLGVQPEKTLNQKSVHPTPAPVPPPAPAPIAKPAPAPLVIKKKSHVVRNVAIISLVFLVFISLLAGGAYYYFVVMAEEETIVVTPEPVRPAPVVPVVPVVQDPVPGVDTDSDGLTDREEQLYATDFRNADSDADSFLDGNEVFHRYDPLGLSPSTLFDTGSVLVYKGTRPDARAFEIYYPKAWTVTEDPAGFTISLPRTETISLAYIANGAIPLNATKSTTKNGFIAYTAIDKRTVTIELENGAFAVFTYELNDATTIEYLQTFQMMVNSYQHVDA